MIPENLVQFIHGPVFLGVGTRNDKLRPHHTWGFGAIVGAERDTITVFVPEVMSGTALSNLRSNGRIALGMGTAGNESYQFKGVFLSSRPTNEKDVTIQEIYSEKVLASLLAAGMPDPLARGILNALPYKPSVAVTFRVEEVYLQTPGPEAGKRLI